MIDTTEFGDLLKEKGFSFYSGVPCSFLKDLINYAINDCRYYMAANEGDAVAICSGAYLAGHKSVVLMQNSGLTNAVSPLTSLNFIFKIPVLGFVSLRGETGIPDEPQHELTGVTTTQQLDLMQVNWEYLSSDLNEAKNQLIRADEYISKKETFFFVVKKDTFSKTLLREQNLQYSANILVDPKKGVDELPTRKEVLEKLCQIRDIKTLFLATTGKTGRELYDIEDSPNHLYMVGSMGCISSLAMGVAEGATNMDVVAIDGDGSLLMRLGALTTIGYYHPSNLLHILLDNNAHDSTGGQLTVSHNVDFVSLAAASGYPVAKYIHHLDELEKYYFEWKNNKRLTFLKIRISKGSKTEPGRPGIKPWQVAERLMKYIHEHN